MSLNIQQRINAILEFVEDTDKMFEKREQTLRLMLKKLQKAIEARDKAKQK